MHASTGPTCLPLPPLPCRLCWCRSCGGSRGRRRARRAAAPTPRPRLPSRHTSPCRRRWRWRSWRRCWVRATSPPPRPAPPSARRMFGRGRCGSKRRSGWPPASACTAPCASHAARSGRRCLRWRACPRTSRRGRRQVGARRGGPPSARVCCCAQPLRSLPAAGPLHATPPHPTTHPSPHPPAPPLLHPRRPVAGEGVGGAAGGGGGARVPGGRPGRQARDGAGAVGGAAHGRAAGAG